MKKLIVILVLVFLSGCKLFKKVNKVKALEEEKSIEQTTSNSNENIERTTKITEEGGRLYTDIVSLEKRYDSITGLYKELKQTYKDGGLTKTIYYKPDGSVGVDCSNTGRLIEINEIASRQQNEFNTKIIERLESLETKDKEEKAKPDSGFWAVLLSIVGVFLIILKKI